MIGWYNLYPMKPSYFRILHTSHSDPTPIRLRVHHSNSDITPTVPRHSPSHAAFHRRSPRSTEFYRIISEITEILLVIIWYILTTDHQPSPLWSLSVIVTRYTCFFFFIFPFIPHNIADFYHFFPLLVIKSFPSPSFHVSLPIISF